MESKWANLEKLVAALEDADRAVKFSRDPEAVLDELGIAGDDRNALRSFVGRLGRLSSPAPAFIMWPGPGKAEFNSVRATHKDGSHVFVAIVELTDVSDRPLADQYQVIRATLASPEHSESFDVPGPTLFPSDPAVLPTHAVFEFSCQIPNAGTYDLTLTAEPNDGHEQTVSIRWPGAVTVVDP